jgi:nucleotide-binding universal stress UspA family protein
MFDPDLILHPTDFSDGARRAFDFALSFAERHGAALRIVSVLPTLGENPLRDAFELQIDEDAFYARADEQAQREMAEFVDAAEARGVDVKASAVRGPSPEDEILEMAEAAGADLLAMGTHGRRGLSRIALGSVAEEVVRRAPCSVLTVRASWEEAPDAIERILVPVDLSEASEPLVRSAGDIARSVGASVDLVHVNEPLPVPAPLLGSITLSDVIEDPEATTRAHLDRLAGDALPAGVEAAAHVLDGHAATAIVDAADDLNADLVVIASHGQSGLERVFLGSVTARVVRRSACPVLTTRLHREDEASGQDARSA